MGSKQKGIKLDGTMKFQVKMVPTGLNSFESETLFKLCPTHEILEQTINGTKKFKSNY